MRSLEPMSEPRSIQVIRIYKQPWGDYKLSSYKVALALTDLSLIRPFLLQFHCKGEPTARPGHELGTGLFAAQGMFCTQKHENYGKNLFSHSRTLYFALSKVWGNSSTQGWKMRHLRGAILYFRQEGMAPAASCTQHSCVPDPTPARVLLYSRCTYSPKQVFTLQNPCVLEANRL